MLLRLGLAQLGPFLVHSDNLGVISIINKRRSQSFLINHVLQQIHILLAPHGMYLQAFYVPSHENIVDALSQGDITTFLQSFP